MAQKKTATSKKGNHYKRSSTSKTGWVKVSGYNVGPHKRHKPKKGK